MGSEKAWQAGPIKSRASRNCLGWRPAQTVASLGNGDGISQETCRTAYRTLGTGVGRSQRAAELPARKCPGIQPSLPANSGTLGKKNSKVSEHSSLLTFPGWSSQCATNEFLENNRRATSLCIEWRCEPIHGIQYSPIDIALAMSCQSSAELST